MLADASNFVQPINSAFIIIVIICVFFLLLITTLMIVFVLKYSSKRNKNPKNIEGSIPLEITWTLIPTILVMFIFWIGWSGYKQLTDVPKDAMEIDVYAQMWTWSYKYSNGVKSDTLFVPVNKPIKVLLHSRDVDHSFYVPAFRIKKDVIPNMNNTAWFLPTRIGSYDVFCAEYCGLRHSYMYSVVDVLPEDTFNSWLSDQAKKQSAGQTSSSSDSSAVIPDTASKQ
jgi:cytochrome c oxidase subunit 2